MLDDDNNENNDKKSSGPGLPSIDMPEIDDDFNRMPEIDDDLNKMPGIEQEEDLEVEDKEQKLNLELEEEMEESEPQQKKSKPDIYKALANAKKSGKDKKKDGSVDNDDYNPDYEADLESLEEEKFIDKKKKRLIPFGGEKSKKKKFVKSSDFDDRKNKLAKTKIIQFSILAVIAILFLLGLKNTFIPSHVYSGDEIRQFAAEGAGQTGFPEDRGRAYVESFMDVYLTFDREKPELTKMLSHFYGEELTNDESSKFNTRRNSESKQHVITPPRVFEVELLTEYSAQYKVSTYVSNTDGEEVVEGEPVGRWLSFAVNVYYDVENDSLVITPDSPSIIPSYRIIDQAVIPDRYPLGNGEVNKEIAPALTPTINGFIAAYAESSADSRDSVLQYIDNKDDINLYDGFGGAVEINGDPADAIKKIIYNNNDGVYRADVTVNWVDVAASQGENQVEYTSRYIMRIAPIGDGKYAVSSFVPYNYYK